jgi:hypothetical protein
MNAITIQKTHTHYRGGHCESGAVYSLLKNFGFDLSEPMAFGISSNISFVYLPFVKIWGRPLIAFRMMPHSIVKGVQKRLGIKFWMKTYKYDQQLEAMEELDRLLSEGKPVGVQLNVSFLEYFMGDFRVPINHHTATIHRKEGDEYIVSDPLFDTTERVKYEDMQKARFAKGPNAPCGFIFYPLHVPETINYKNAIKKSVKRVVTMMLQPMFPYYGILGIKTFARAIRKLNNHPDKKFLRNFMGHIIIFQEEQGTGGGAFRYMYAAFLKEVYDMLLIPELLGASKKIVAAGDKWRLAAASCGKFIQGKTDTVDLNKTAQLYLECAMEEKEAYLLLKKIKWNKVP